jgi:hypothetical protein
MAGRSAILLPNRQSAELAAIAPRQPAAIYALALEYIDETLSVHPEWVVEMPRKFSSLRTTTGCVALCSRGRAK